ncbi:MAG TPA: ABC transporter ATP-binding protein, partial [Lacibacter sp.]|nr:ABC transporter ATP-binding protein [Lacibacter sp.]
VHDPRLIVLDEPTNGLDPQGIADMRNLILQLSHKMGKTVLVSSHLLSEVEQIANRMLIIDKGKKRVEGEVRTLFHPDDTVVHLQVSDAAACQALLQQGPYATRLKGRDAGGLELGMRKEEVPAFNRYLVQAGVEVLGISARHSLEDYFLKITTSNQHVEAYTD